MAVPTYLNEGGGDKVLNLTDAAEAAKYLAAIELASSPAGYGWMGVATHVEGDAVLSPGGFTTSAVPLVLMGGDDGTSAKPLQVDASAFLKVILQSNTGVDIGDVDIASIAAGDNNIGNVDIVTLPAANLGQRASAASLSVVPASDIADATYIGDIKFGEGLPAGSNNIGDVDVLSVITGTGATNLGKAVDTSAGGTDTGVAALVIRDDSLTTLTPIDGDYTYLRVSSTGALHVTGGGGGTQFNVDAALGSTPEGMLAIAKRDDALSALGPVEGDAIELRVDANGALWTHDDALDAALSGSELQVDVVAALPTGANTIGDVTISGAALTALQLIDNAIAGTEMQVDIVAALPAGTNEIGKLAAGSAVIGEVTIGAATGAAGDLAKAEDAQHASGDIGVMSLAVRNDTLAALGGTDGDYVPFQVDADGSLYVNIKDGNNTITVDGTITASNTAGDIAHDAGDSGNPVKLGGRAQEYLSTADEVANDDRVDALFDRNGYLHVRGDMNPKTAIINANTNGDNTIIAASAGKKIAVWAIVIVSDGTTDVRWEDGAGTPLTGQVPLQAREGYSISAGGMVPLLLCSSNTLLNLELTANVFVHGWVSYSLIDD